MWQTLKLPARLPFQVLFIHLTNLFLIITDMPPVRSARSRKPPPDGFDDLEDTLLEFSNKMKDAENASHEGKKRHEVLWPIFQITHQRAYGPFAWALSRAAALLSAYLQRIIRFKIHLWSLLWERGYLEDSVRLAPEEWLCGRKLDCEVEETRIWEGSLHVSHDYRTSLY